MRENSWRRAWKAGTSMVALLALSSMDLLANPNQFPAALVSEVAGRPGEVAGHSPASNLHSVPAHAICDLQSGVAWLGSTELGSAQSQEDYELEMP